MSIVRHTSYNIVGAVVPIAVSLVTVPLYLKVVGLERYGVLTIARVIIGYFNFFDLGLGRATAKQIASSGANDPAARNRAFWTATSLSAVLAACAVVVATPVAAFALASLKIGSPELRGEVSAALPLLIAALPVSLLQSTLRGALEGRSRFLVINLIFSIGAVATAALPLVSAVAWGPGIPELVGTTLIVRIAVLAALAVAATREVPLGRPVRPSRTDLHRLLKFGAWLTISNVIGPIMVFFDRFLIGALIGTAAVALYAIPFNLISQLLLIPVALANALFPRFAAETGDRRKRNEALRATAFVLTPMAFVAVALVGPFLRLWIGAEAAAQSTPVAYILMVGFWANGLAQLPFASLQAAGRTDAPAKVHLIEVIPYLLLLWACLRWLGLPGAALAWTLRGTADLFALAILDRTQPVLIRTIAAQAAALSGVAAIMLATRSNPVLQWSAILVLAALMGGYVMFAMPPILRERLRPWLAILGQR
jgi:O-antigen/teichoic acid export membrane protein